ncbi:MAG: hypothetical protein EA424_13590 [Planctomycetaceae bacterium]|nr:MAG: hypothetical protein EA424_13590 [Planctomycetaceae bacterium]
MIRRVLLLLAIVLLLHAASNWRRFQERSRPSLQPLIDWTLPEAEPASDFSELPSGPDFKSAVISASEYWWRSPTADVDPGSALEMRLDASEIEGAASHTQRLAAVDAALARAQREAGLAEQAIRQLEAQTDARHNDLQNRTLAWAERRQQELTLDAEFRRSLYALEAKRDLWREEVRRVEAMRKRLADIKR